MPIAKLSRGLSVSNFLEAASIQHANNTETIYVVALGMNIGLAKLVVSEIDGKELYLKNEDWEFRIVGRKGKEIQCYVAELLKT